MSNRLAEIVEQVREETRARQASTSGADLEARAQAQPAPRSLQDALRRPPGAPLRVIGELKRRSPSAGIIREGLDPATAAQTLVAAGCSALSVLTEPNFFGGSLDTLAEVRAAVSVPLLRKDFLVGTFQIVEARAHGADAVLLLAAVLSDTELRECRACAREWGMDVLAEAHGEAELDRLLRLDLPVLGVNARDLTTFDVDLDRSLAWRQRIPKDRIAVAESGIRTRADAQRVEAANFDAALCGEGLMRGDNLTDNFRNLFGGDDA